MEFFFLLNTTFRNLIYLIISPKDYTILRLGDFNILKGLQVSLQLEVKKTLHTYLIHLYKTLH